LPCFSRRRRRSRRIFISLAVLLQEEKEEQEEEEKHGKRDKGAAARTIPCVTTGSGSIHAAPYAYMHLCCMDPVEYASTSPACH
jgi:hypothetical protein